MYAQLGDIVFERLIGFTNYKMTGTEKYAQHQLINLLPRLDHTGSELRVFKFDIKYHADFCVPENEIALLWANKNLANILPFIFGNGRVIGNFVITEIEEALLQTLPDGTYVMAEVSVSLIEAVVPDVDTQEQQKASQDAIAITENNPNPVRGIPRMYDTLTGGVLANGIFALATSENADNYVSYTEADPSILGFSAEQIQDALDDLGDALNVAQALQNGDYVSALQTLAPYVDWVQDNANVISNLNIAYNAVVNMQSLFPITDINDIIVANTYLQGAMQQYQVSLTQQAVLHSLHQI